VSGVSCANEVIASAFTNKVRLALRLKGVPFCRFLMFSFYVFLAHRSSRIR
jgi:hypothetical protein